MPVEPTGLTQKPVRPRRVISGALGLAAALVVVAPGCGDGASVPDAAVDANPICEGDVRRVAQIYNGTALPSYVPLSEGQIMAIGMFVEGTSGVFCSGTLIAPSWVLTAHHCEVSTSDRFCIGAAPDNPDICFDVQATATNGNDMTLVDLGVDVRTVAPAVEPIPILTEIMDDSWLGDPIEIAGYGEQEDESIGVREFSAEVLYQLDEELVTVNGEGEHGACWGDSGGPAMVIASDSSVRVAGELYNGSLSCTGYDHYSRTDLQVAWIETFTGPTLVGEGPYPCGSITEEGRCMQGGKIAVWCDQNLQRVECASEAHCGWDGAVSGYRCVEGSDPCGGDDEFGSCDGNVARWCESGVPRYSDCASCLSLCQLSAIAGGAVCVPDPCHGIDYLGECQGDVVVWCASGELLQRDCAADGKVCQYVDENLGYWCQ